MHVCVRSNHREGGRREDRLRSDIILTHKWFHAQRPFKSQEVAADIKTRRGHEKVSGYPLTGQQSEAKGKLSHSPHRRAPEVGAVHAGRCQGASSNSHDARGQAHLASIRSERGDSCFLV